MWPLHQALYNVGAAAMVGLLTLLAWRLGNCISQLLLQFLETEWPHWSSLGAEQ
jgi:hypothetical protein